MKKQSFKRILSILLSLMMVMSAWPFNPVTAAAADSWAEGPVDDYEYAITVKTTDDADGWNKANMQIFTFDDETYTTSTKEVTYDIKNNIDTQGGTVTKVYKSRNFLQKVRIYIDFGGGVTWRDWQGEITVRINGVLIAKVTDLSDSSIFSSSDDDFDIIVPPDKYPAPDLDNSNFYVKSADSEAISEDLMFYQGRLDSKNEITGYFYAELVDQYNVLWRHQDKLIFDSKTHGKDQTTGEVIDRFEYLKNEGTKSVFKVTSTFGSDHVNTLTLICPWNEQDKAEQKGTELDLDVQFLYRHTLTVKHNKKSDPYATYTGYAGQTLENLDLGLPAGYSYKSAVATGNGVFVNHKDGTCDYTYGSSDSVIKLNYNANSYFVDYDKNADDAEGEMASTLATYDKDVKISNCLFTREHYTFVGWNTEPDGSGISLNGGVKATKPNLTTEADGAATLYAQWERKTVNVTVNYPEETGMEAEIVAVPEGGSYSPVQYIDVNADNGHYVYVSADQDLSNITEDITVNLAYTFLKHYYGEWFVTVDATCTTDGEEVKACQDCGYEISRTIPASHQNVQEVPGHPASCTTDGVETEIKCLACNTVLEQGTIIPAYGHDFDYDNVVWSYSTKSGALKAYATVTCKNNENHKDTVEATVTEESNGYTCTADFGSYQESTFLEYGKDIYKISISSSEGGTINARPAVALAGDTVKIEPNPEQGKYLYSVMIDNKISYSYSFTMPSKNVTLKATFADAQANQCGQNAYWKVDKEKNALVIYGSGDMFDYGENSIYGIAPWRDGIINGVECSQIIIEDGITSIGANAFRDYRVLADVTMANTVTSIGNYAFAYTAKLGQISLSDNLETIGDYAFYGSTYATVNHLPATLTNIGKNIFEGGNDSNRFLYCYADPANLTVADNNNSVPSIIFVYSQYVNDYTSKFSGVTGATFRAFQYSGTHSINVVQADHGTVSTNYSEAAYGETVTVNAVPDSGYGVRSIIVTNSSGNAVTVTGNTFKMPNSNVTVTAEFAPTYNICISYTNEQADYGTASAPLKAVAGETVTVTMTPNKGYESNGILVLDTYGMGVQTTDNTFVMPESNVLVYPYFMEKMYTITRTASEHGYIDSADSCLEGARFTIYDHPDTGYVLDTLTATGTSGTEYSISNSTLTMPAENITVSATFKPCPHDYDVSCTWVDSENAPESATFTFTCSNANCQHTESVNGEITRQDTREKVIYVATAELEGKTYTNTHEFRDKVLSDILIYTNENCAVTADLIEAYEDETVTLTATPNDGYSFVGYTVTDKEGTEIEVTNGKFTMPASEVTVETTVAPVDYTVQWVVGGSVVETDEVAYGTVPEYNGETPAPYTEEHYIYTFFGWSDGTNTYATDELPAVTGDVTYTAAYLEENVPTWHTVKLKHTYLMDICEASGYEGDRVYFDLGGEEDFDRYNTYDKLEATEFYYDTDEGEIYFDVEWDFEAKRAYFTMPNKDMTAKAKFYSWINLTVGTYDHATITVDKNKVIENETATITAQVEEGWIITRIYQKSGYMTCSAKQDENNPDIWYFTPTDGWGSSDSMLYVDFAPDPTYHTVKLKHTYLVDICEVSGYEGDRVYFDLGGEEDFDRYNTYDKLEATEFYYDTDEGKIYFDVEWDFEAKRAYFTMPDKDMTAKAKFYSWINLTVGTYDHAAITVDKERIIENETATITAQVEEGWIISSIYQQSGYMTCRAKQDENNPNIWYFTPTDGWGSSDSMLYVDFERISNWYTITINESENGTVSYEKSGAYTDDEVTLIVTPDEGCALMSLKVEDADGNEVPVTGNTFTMPASDVTVSAEFKAVEYTEAVEPYIDENDAYIVGTKAHYTDANGVNYAVNEDGSIGEVLDDLTLSYFEFALLDDDTYRITSYTGSTAITELVIPKTYNDKKITVIGSTKSSVPVVANENTAGYQYSLVLNENITEIGDYAFYAKYVNTVTGDTSGLKKIARYAFSWANSPDAYEISLDLNYDGTIQTGYCAFNHMKVTFNLKHSTEISFNTPNSQSISYNFTDAHVYGEPEWTWTEDYSSATATFMCTDSRCNHQEAVQATVSYEDKDNKRTYTATAEVYGTTYTDTRETDIPAVKIDDKYNLTLTENIDVNILIDVKGHAANGEEIEKIVYTYPDVTTQSGELKTETVTDITADVNGYFAKSFTMAMAQAGEPITATLYYANGETKEITVSVASYCKYIIDNAETNGYSDKLVDLCYTVLEYGKTAKDYFNYSSDAAYPDYTLPEKYANAPEITSTASFQNPEDSVIKKENLTGVQVYILSKATLRLLFNVDISNLEVLATIGTNEPCTLQPVKTADGRWAVDFSGLYATELNKPVTFTFSDGTTINYAATDWAKSVIANGTTEKSKALAKALYYYSEAANNYFGG